MTNVKKSIILCIVVFIVGASIGVVLTRNFSGLLAGAAGILPAISLLGASKRSNNSISGSDGSIGEGIDEITGAIKQGSDHITTSKRSNRTAGDILRRAAKPIKMDRDSSSGPGNNNINNKSN